MKHGDFDLRWHSYEPRRLLPQLPSRTPRQLFLRCSMINRAPRLALRYVQTHWRKTLNRKLFSARNCMWIKAQTSQETAHHDTPALQHGKILAHYGKIALVEVTKRTKL
jgi:hypothetical protein